MVNGLIGENGVFVVKHATKEVIHGIELATHQLHPVEEETVLESRLNGKIVTLIHVNVSHLKR